jgi:hypothetical protein
MCWAASWRASRRFRRGSSRSASATTRRWSSFPGAPPLLQTVDFFRALVDDPYLFGRIAATHALGDIYAMGGVPETALAIAALPPARPAITEHDLFHMLKGGTEVLGGRRRGPDRRPQRRGRRAGARLCGDRPHAAGPPVAQRRLRPGDRLILTKPLGTGVILAAEMRGRWPARVVPARSRRCCNRRPRRRRSSPRTGRPPAPT